MDSLEVWQLGFDLMSESGIEWVMAKGLGFCGGDQVFFYMARSEEMLVFFLDEPIAFIYSFSHPI